VSGWGAVYGQFQKGAGLAPTEKQTNVHRKKKDKEEREGRSSLGNQKDKEGTQ
jgi:hypothetical protein